MINDKFFQAELIERIDFTGELALFKFKPEDAVPSFKPGQYATIALEDGDKILQRPYSLVSSPHEAFLEFFLELVPHGDLTPRLWEMYPGSQVLIRKRIVGAFTLDEHSGMNRHVMAATVTGIAPFLSMVRKQQEDIRRGCAQPHEFLILHGASRSWEMGIYQDELTRLSSEEWVHYVPTVSRPWEDIEWKGEAGRVEDILRKYTDALGFTASHTVGYACGNPQMIENAKGIFQRAHFHKEHIREEKYFH